MCRFYMRPLGEKNRDWKWKMKMYTGTEQRCSFFAPLRPPNVSIFSSRILVIFLPCIDINRRILKNSKRFLLKADNCFVGISQMFPFYLLLFFYATCWKKKAEKTKIAWPKNGASQILSFVHRLHSKCSQCSQTSQGSQCSRCSEWSPCSQCSQWS